MPIIHRVIDTDISVKMSSTHVWSDVTYLEYISTAIEQSNIVSRWLPTVTTSIKMDQS